MIAKAAEAAAKAASGEDIKNIFLAGCSILYFRSFKSIRKS
jgi:hypothetical protein